MAWGHHIWAGTVFWDVAFRTAADRADFLAVTFFEVRDEIFVVLVLAEIGNQWEFINLELLVLWGMGIIKSPPLLAIPIVVPGEVIDESIIKLFEYYEIEKIDVVQKNLDIGIIPDIIL